MVSTSEQFTINIFLRQLEGTENECKYKPFSKSDPVYICRSSFHKVLISTSENYEIHEVEFFVHSSPVKFIRIHTLEKIYEYSR